MQHDLKIENAQLRAKVMGLELALDQQSAAPEMLKHDARLCLLTDHLPVLVSYVDKEQRYQFNNKVYEDWFLKPRDNVYGSAIPKILGEAAYEAIKPYILGALRGHIQQFESEVDYISGRRHIHATYIPHQLNNEVLGFFAVVIDISKEKSQQAELEKGLAEKQTLLQEIHHRVKNNLQFIESLLHLHSGYINDEAAISAIDNCRSQILLISDIHKALYTNPDEQNPKENNNHSGLFLQQLLSLIKRVCFNRYPKVTFSTQVEDIELTFSQTITLGILLNELVENACKHAFSGTMQGEINVVLVKNPDQTVTLKVGNNGSQLPEALNIENPTSMGLKLIKLLSAQLESNLTIDRGEHTEFVFNFLPQ